MNYTVIENPNFGKVSAILMDNGKWYFCTKDIAGMISDGYITETSLTAKMNARCMDRIKHPVWDLGGFRKRVFISRDFFNEIWTRPDNNKEPIVKKWLLDATSPPRYQVQLQSNTTSVVEEMSRQYKNENDLVKNPDFGIKLLTTLKEKDQRIEELEETIKTLTYKAKLADAVISAVGSMTQNMIGIN